MSSRTWRWIPRHGEKLMGEQALPDPFERGDDSKDDRGVSRRGGHGPEPPRVSEPSTCQRWPNVPAAALVNDECPRERAVESLIQSERGQRWLDEISQGLRLSGNLSDLLHRRIRFLFIQGGRVARDLGMVDVDDQLIAALDSLRGDVWSCVLRDSTSLVTLLLSLAPSVLDRGLGPVGNILMPEFFWDFLAPLDFQEVTARDLGEMPKISPEGLIMARALVRDKVLWLRRLYTHADFVAKRHDSWRFQHPFFAPKKSISFFRPTPRGFSSWDTTTSPFVAVRAAHIHPRFRACNLSI